jgi:hypothetical protein
MIKHSVRPAVPPATKVFQKGRLAAGLAAGAGAGLADIASPYKRKKEFI